MVDRLEEGTGEGCSWFMDEAECSDGSSDEEEDGNNTFDSVDSISGFIDDERQFQGNTRGLYQMQGKEEAVRHIQLLKRKLLSSPESSQTRPDVDLSPRLNAISLSPRKRPEKRRLFISQQDSGNETACSIEDTYQVVGDSAVAVSDRGHNDNLGILRASNRIACMLGVFKDVYGVGFKELTREYKSNRTCNPDWVVMAYGIREQVLEEGRKALHVHCDYVFQQYRPSEKGPVALMMLRFHHGKCRDTLTKQICQIFHIDPLLCIMNPPRVQSVPAALYWYKSSLSPATHIHGVTPEWIQRQTMVSAAVAGEEAKFDLSVMVQWAYDNDYNEESTIAFEYAKRADEDQNANAWLSSNAQAKHLKDCATMVRHYKRAEMKTLSMSKWVWRCCREVEEEGDWKPISIFLRSQGVEVIAFLTAMRAWLKGVPKKNCIVISGPPNTGKSVFCMSLMSFLKGRVISYANSKSHFWMQPITEAKVVLLDDATRSTWDYVDTYLRNALDGNPVSVDCKYKAPIQTKCPPMLITTNEDVATNDRWRYLHSRIQVFYFRTPMPVDARGQAQFTFNNSHWKSFFKRLQRPLDLSEDEGEDNNGEPGVPFKCSARGADVHV
ncbi:E1 [Peromyscus papillomavirus 1]|uniref:Replication protein E1 n=1 Tax=Peromyscus papillomavirus 1 TaxID=1074206 RepID=G1C9I5_9PAPI|nr:E1 [Peromyscus papillomavirus 1]AEM05818.1 E1 [Peromyscus papillomavirus 1]